MKTKSKKCCVCGSRLKEWEVIECMGQKPVCSCCSEDKEWDALDILDTVDCVVMFS